MLIYHGQRYDSASIGGRLAEVVCDKCGCEYFYELVRIGSGAATAPYNVGKQGAARSAQDQSRRDLDRRLAEEAECVPCPKCRWINDDLVEGYRRGRYRGWSKAAAALIVVGIAVSLLGAWFLSLGPAADRGAVPYLLFGGPLMSASAAGFLLGLRQWLRNRIRPNSDYPHPPTVPPGSPMPLVRDPATGDYVSAGPPPEQGETSGAALDFQVGRSTLPAVCCECLDPATPGCAYLHPVRAAVSIPVPLCRACVRRARKRQRLGALAGLGIVLGFELPVLFVLRLDEVAFWFVLGVSALLVPVISAMVAGRVTSPVRVTIVDRSRGVARLRFRNDDYLKRVTGRGAS